MARFKGAKPGDIIKVETKAESGYALVIRVADDGLVWMPVPNNFQRGRENRPHLKAHEIKEVFRKLKV